jgi:ABC-2 type transport system permease protein
VDVQAKEVGGDGRFESWRRTEAVLRKEFLMLLRDRVTLAAMVVMPLMLVLLHGYALDSTPHHLPTAWIASEESDVGFELRSALEQTGFFRVTRYGRTIEQVDHWLKSGEITFVVELPAGFERRLRRGEYPPILISADATDPIAMAIALGSLDGVKATVLSRLRGLERTTGESADFELRVHRRYNPAGSTKLNIVPGMLGIILSVTMTVFTALSVTREYERGTMENLLAMPIRAREIMFGKLLPYVIIGIGQAILILAIAFFVFQIPMVGSLSLLGMTTVLFIITNLAIGYTFSTISENQLQTMQLTNIFFLPSIMLSGIIFPFSGMPRWAQLVSECLPLTHFARIANGIMLKGSDLAAVTNDSAALCAIMVAAMAVALMRFRATLD